MFKEKVLPVGKVFYSDLLPELEHYFTTRESSITLENKVSWADSLKTDKDNLISPTQTHSTNIDITTVGQNEYPETDGLILTNKEQAIYLRFADCTPVILYDKKNNIGAISHAGWRGTVGGIVPKTVKKMLELNEGTRAEDIFAIIGPAISSCCYAVGNEVIEAIKCSVADTTGLFDYKYEKVFVDLKGVNARQLEECGIPLENIDICPYCTSCNNDLFFSYRKENGTTKRHNAIIKLH